MASSKGNKKINDVTIVGSTTEYEDEIQITNEPILPELYMDELMVPAQVQPYPENLPQPSSSTQLQQSSTPLPYSTTITPQPTTVNSLPYPVHIFSTPKPPTPTTPPSSFLRPTTPQRPTKRAQRMRTAAVPQARSPRKVRSCRQSTSGARLNNRTKTKEAETNPLPTLEQLRARMAAALVVMGAEHARYTRVMEFQKQYLQTLVLLSINAINSHNNNNNNN